MFLTAHGTIKRILLKPSPWASWWFSRLSIWGSLGIWSDVVFYFLFVFKLLLFVFFKSLHFFFVFSLICLEFCLSILLGFLSDYFIVSKNLLFSFLKFEIFLFLNRISHDSHQFGIIYRCLHRFKITRSHKSMPKWLTIFIQHIFYFILLLLLHFFCLTLNNLFKIIWIFQQFRSILANSSVNLINKLLKLIFNLSLQFMKSFYLFWYVWHCIICNCKRLSVKIWFEFWFFYFFLNVILTLNSNKLH